VHHGHVALAELFARLLRPDELRIMPAGQPWQKRPACRPAMPTASRCWSWPSADAGLPVTIDTREIARDTPTYTVETLRELRAELGPDASIVFLMGADQLQKLDSWRDWKDLFALANFGVAARPGYRLDAAALPPAVAAELAPRLATPKKYAQARRDGSAWRTRWRSISRPPKYVRPLECNASGKGKRAPCAASARLYSTTQLIQELMDIKKLQTLVVDALEDVKGQDIALFDTTNLTSLFDRIAVVSGTSNRQTKALAASVRDKVKAAGGDVIGLEGEDTGEWVLVDLGDMIVHIMQPAIRQYYRLEEIWGEKPVKLGAAKRKSTVEGVEAAAAPKTKGKHLAANQEQPEAKPVRERKPAAKRARSVAAAPRSRAKKPAAKIPTGARVKVAVSKTAAASAAAAKAAKAAAPKRATKAAARPKPKAQHRPRKSSAASRRPTNNFNAVDHCRGRPQDAGLDRDRLRGVRQAHAARAAHRAQGNQAGRALRQQDRGHRDGARTRAHRSRAAEGGAHHRPRRARQGPHQRRPVPAAGSLAAGRPRRRLPDRRRRRPRPRTERPAPMA
jgi:ribosome-associated protein